MTFIQSNRYIERKIALLNLAMCLDLLLIIMQQFVLNKKLNMWNYTTIKNDNEQQTFPYHEGVDLLNWAREGQC